jgi:filamentous hemagglutinin family protein
MKLQSITGFIGVSTLFLGCYPSIAQAQITPDATLGAESSRLTPNVVIQGGNADRIDGGATRGGNLFHSFSQFNVADGQRLYFSSPAGVQNILTRVTGGRSDILGTLGVNGAANLFLLNPNGIVFGPNAQLDVGGSFIGSTASGVQFGNQGEFTVNQAGAPPLLTIQPSALMFTPQSTGNILSSSIAVAGTSPSGRNLLGLQVPTGQSLILAGGDVRIDGGGINGGLNAQGGRIELGGLVGSGSIGLDTSSGQPKLVFPGAGTRSNVSLVNNARVSVRGTAGGDAAVNANVFTAVDGGRIVAGTEGAGNAGEILVNANVMDFSGVSLDGIGASSGLSNQVLMTGTGRGGGIKVNTNQLTITSGAGIDTITFGQGSGGDILINARNSILLDGANRLPTRNDITLISASIVNGAGPKVVQGGKAQITTKELTLLNGAQIISSNFGTGNAGDISINAKTIILQGKTTNADGILYSGLESYVDRGAIGNAGNISVQTDTLNILDDAAIETYTGGRGNAGNINVSAKDSVLLFNSIAAITSGVQREGIGQGGNIQIQTPSLTLANISTIDSNMRGQGNGGSIFIDVANLSVERQGDFLIESPFLGLITTTLTGTGTAGGIAIKARDRIALNDASISSNVLDGGSYSPLLRGKGAGGKIQISSKDIDLSNSTITTSSTGEGNAGSISVVAENLLKLDKGSRITADVSSFRGSKAIGDAGKIDLKASSIFIMDKSVVSSDTSSLGNAGDISIKADKQLVVDGGNARFASISSTVFDEGTGQGGDVTITAPFLSLNRGVIFAATLGVGDAGKIKITANEMTLDQKGIITTTTGGKGNAGDITLDVDRVSLNNISFISSQVGSNGKKSDTQGNGGTLRIKAKSLELSGGSQLNTSTEAVGRAGDVEIQATDSINIIGMSAGNIQRSGIYSIVDQTGKDRGGNIQISTGNLTIADDASISASTFGQGRAGDIRVNADRSIFISGTDRFDETSGLYSASRTDSAAGDIFVTTPRLTLNNRATLRTDSNTVDGGDININTDVLLLRRNSNISATAGLTQGAGNGGNINLFSNVIVAVAKENSDITANAFSGSGGTVNIQTNGLFGIAPRLQPTPLSDITASSAQGVQGTIAITQPDTSPEQGLTELPGDILDASNQIDQSCPNARNNRPIGQFVITGRGSLPASPLDPLGDNPNLPALAQLTQADRPIANAPTPVIAPIPTAPTIVEAQGWQKTPDGKVILLAQPIVTTMPTIASASNAFACVTPSRNRPSM